MKYFSELSAFLDDINNMNIRKNLTIIENSIIDFGVVHEYFQNLCKIFIDKNKLDVLIRLTEDMHAIIELYSSVSIFGISNNFSHLLKLPDCPADKFIEICEKLINIDVSYTYVYGVHIGLKELFEITKNINYNSLDVIIKKKNKIVLTKKDLYDSFRNVFKIYKLKGIKN